MEEIQYRAFKFRLLPTELQKELFAKHFGCVRIVYNYFLNEKKEHYLKNKTTLNFNNCSDMLTKLKQQTEYEWLQEVNSQSLQASLKNLETAYGRFFRKISSFPNYKKRNNYNSFNCPQQVKILTNKIQLPKFKEGIKFVNYREIKGKIKSATVSKTPTGKCYVSILCEISKSVALPKTGKQIGIDLGLTNFLITSEGQKYNNPRFLKKHQVELKKAQQHFSRKQKNSKRREKARLKVARIYEKITNSRENMQHQVSSSLLKKYDLIALEDLSVKQMMQNHKLAKAIGDVAWSSFVTKLKYKANWYGKEIIEIDKFFPSSKTCSNCSHIKEDLKLSERSWICSSCNTEHDRDINAAKNILQRALILKSSGTDDYRQGAEVRPKTTKVVQAFSNELSKKKRIRTLKPLEV